MFLRGATKLFNQKIPPFFTIEMALGTTQKFGYLPNDLIEFIGSRAEYLFYKLDDKNGSLPRKTALPRTMLGQMFFAFRQNVSRHHRKN